MDRFDLLRIREELGLKQDELAALVGLNPATISRMELGKTPIDRLAALAFRLVEAANSKPTFRKLVCDVIAEEERLAGTR